jgi:hypothetical protein
MTARVVVPGSSVGNRPTTADTKEKRLIATVDVAIPLSAIGDGFDADEARIAVEEFTEKLVKTLFEKIDESRFCEPAWTEMYRTTQAWCESGNYCLGKTEQSHIHADETYGRNLNEFWVNMQVFIDPNVTDEEEDEEEEISEKEVGE